MSKKKELDSLKWLETLASETIYMNAGSDKTYNVRIRRLKEEVKLLRNIIKSQYKASENK